MPVASAGVDLVCGACGPVTLVGRLWPVTLDGLQMQASHVSRQPFCKRTGRRSFASVMRYLGLAVSQFCAAAQCCSY